MKFTHSPVAILLGALTLSGIARGADWPHWRGTDRNGISTETGWQAAWLDADPPIAWKAEVGIGFSSIAIANGNLFTLGNNDNIETVYCLDAETGVEVWKHTYECALEPRFFEGGPTSTPTVDGDAIYTLSREGHLFCFDAASGRIRWSKMLTGDFDLRAPGWGFAGSPLVHEDLLLLNAGAGGLALKKDSGDLVWKSGDAEAGYSTPFPYERDGRHLGIFSNGKAWAGVDLKTGEEQWRISWLTRYGVNAADPILSGDALYVSSGYNKGAGLFRLNGGAEPEEIWKNKEMHNQMNPCVLIEGHLYGFDGDEDAKPELRCIEFATGRTVWSQKGIGGSGVTAADGKLILLSGYGELIIARASPEKFEELTRVQVLAGKCWTVPVLANGRIYCRNAEGDLVCVDVRKKS